MTTGYIYLRTTEWLASKQAIKLGKTINPYSRNATYVTGEYEAGSFIKIFKIIDYNLDDAEEILKKEFDNLRIRNNTGGTEFFQEHILFLIEDRLNYLQIKNECVNYDDIIHTMSSKNVNTSKIISIKPFGYQQNVLDKIHDFYSKHAIGKLIWSCGLGKSLMSILITQHLDCKRILIGVPTVFLQQQFRTSILNIYPNTNNILFVGGNDKSSTTNKDTIQQFLSKDILDGPLFIITTYSSCPALLGINNFDIKIGDEAHHLVGYGIMNDDNTGVFTRFHNIASTRTLFMTATEKIVESLNDRQYSMDNLEVFGEYIDKKSVRWAIENQKIVDYNVVFITNTSLELHEISRNYHIDNFDLLVSAYMTLKSIQFYNGLNHILIYTNKKESAQKISDYLNILINDCFKEFKDNIYNKALYSGTDINIAKELQSFRKASIGIISCVLILGEGFDEPCLNGVCFAENMQSPIRTTQCALRPIRLDKQNTSKIAYILLPYKEDQTDSFDKCKKIISTLRNVDECIEYKMRFAVVSNVNSCVNAVNPTSDDTIIIENQQELEKIKLRLRYSKTLTSQFNEELDEYNYIRAINQSLGIDSILAYVQSKDKHIMFIPNPDKYYKLKGLWKNWYHFFGKDTNGFIQTKQSWKKFCNNLNIQSINEYQHMCNIYPQLPKEPAEFYAGFGNIQFELGLLEERIRRY